MLRMAFPICGRNDATVPIGLSEPYLSIKINTRKYPYKNLIEAEKTNPHPCEMEWTAVH